MNGIPNSPLNRYFQVKRPIITQNTFVGTRVSILFGLGADGEKTLLPEDVLFGQNVVFTENGKSVVTAYVPADDVTWSENVFYGTQLGIQSSQWYTMGESRVDKWSSRDAVSVSRRAQLPGKEPLPHIHLFRRPMLVPRGGVNLGNRIYWRIQRVCCLIFLLRDTEGAKSLLPIPK